MNINSENNFPSTFEDSKVKRDKSYILQYAKDLWRNAKSESTTFNFATRKDRYINNRKYSEGLQSIEKFKHQFSVDGDNTYLNFDWGVSTPLPKMVEVFRGQMLNQPFKPQFIPVDSTSLTRFDREKKLMQAKMILNKELAPMIEKKVIRKEEGVPEDSDELEIYFQTNFKLAQSIAMESITRAVLDDNDMDYINNKIAKDLIDLKIAAVRICLDENKNIQIQYVDPVNLVTSFVREQNFKDAKHIGVIKEITIDDLRVQASGELSEEQLFDIAHSVAGRYGNGSWNSSFGNYYNTNLDWSRLNKFKVLVLDFEFFSTDDISVTNVSARNGGFKTLINETPKNSKAEKRTSNKKIKNVYTGNYIVDTDYIYGYGLKEHIIRERLNGKYSTSTSLGFVVYAPDIYDMENKSKVEEMIPYADELIRIQLKMQQIIAKAAPSGYAINIDSVVEGLNGMGLGGMKPLDARSIRDQIGDIYYKSIREDGTPLTNGGPPIINLPNGLDQSVAYLSQAYNEVLMRMKETIGVNDAIDAAQPDKKALIGVQKLAVAAHKTALKNLYDTYLKINEDVVRYVAILSQQLIRKGINKDKFVNMVGEEAIKQIALTDLAMCDFAIDIKMLPDAEEMAYIENKVEIALMSNPPMINLQDAFSIRRVMKEDVDKAEQLLAIRETKRMKESLQRSQQMQQENAALQAQVAQAAEQAKAQTEQLKAQLTAQNTQLEYDLKLRNDKMLEEEKRKTMIVELDGKKELIREAAKQQGGGVSTGSEDNTKQMQDISLFGLSRDARQQSGSAYDKLNMPNASGTKMPAVTPSTDFT